MVSVFVLCLICFSFARYTEQNSFRVVLFQSMFARCFQEYKPLVCFTTFLSFAETSERVTLHS